MMSNRRQPACQHIPTEKVREAAKSQWKEVRSCPPKDKPRSHRAKCKALDILSSSSNSESDNHSHEKHRCIPKKRVKHTHADSTGSVEEMVDASLDLELEVVLDRGYIAAESGFEEFQGDDMVNSHSGLDTK